MTTLLKRQYLTSPLQGANAAWIESLYEAYLADPSAVPRQWRQYFGDLGPEAAEVAHGPVRRALESRLRPNGASSLFGGSVSAEDQQLDSVDASAKQAAVSRIIQVYSLRGHQIADLDPLGLWDRPVPAVLKSDYLGLTEEDLEHSFYTGGFAGTGNNKMALRDIIALLKKIYCGKIGAEFAHISRARERLWLRERFESCMIQEQFGADEKRVILGGLTRAEGIERYLNTRYVGQKRFSLEGGETLIPMLDDLIQKSGEGGVHEIVIGMAHRGRLNVLVNVLGKSPQELFSEFEGDYDLSSMKGSGDVKYHQGFSADLRTKGANVHVTLSFNPSHLEIVNPVVEGSCRARQDRRGDREGETVVPVLIHGDAAVAGQGVVAETLQLSQTRAFYTGGTIHIVVNNQIGFTMSKVHDSRSTPYCSDIAKMVEAPVLHVNGDDPEAAVAAMRLALRYRQHFHKDVVIDLVCYRRLGHNEADEPAATQPVMYRTIKSHPTSLALYANRLAEEGVATPDDVRKLANDYRDCLDDGRSPNEHALGMIGNQYTVDWSRYMLDSLETPVDTSVHEDELARLAQRITAVPERFDLHPRVAKIIEDRRRMAADELPMDWGFAETMAYASLLADEYSIRLIGQDSRRGTFFHRHAALYDREDASMHVPLEHISESPHAFTVTDSLLSEEAVLAFEYGYATTTPFSLVVWEAQFGDFVNGAQVVIDQFISSGEAKWGRLSALTMFLPHGYEGQGPEHSSARLERFLQLCAEHNMQVVVPSTPAQMFHLLRRQMLRSLRKPLVVFTPKSLLRHPASTSSLESLSNGRFHSLIDDQSEIDKDEVTRLVFCSGKIYFELAEERRKENINNVALVRIEELYPFPIAEFAATIERYRNATEIVWCQEEPQNQGAWYQIRHRLQEPLNGTHQLYYAGRPGAAAPAPGIHRLHVRQQQALVAAALTATTSEDLSTLTRQT